VSLGSTFEGYVRAGFAFPSHDAQVEGRFSVPLTDTLSVRVARRFSDMSRGFIRNAAQGIFNPSEGLSNPTPKNKWFPSTRSGIGRPTLRYKPNSDFDATLKVLGTSNRATADSFRQVVCKTGRSVNLGVLVDPYDDCKLNGTTSYGVLPAKVAANFPTARADAEPYNKFDAVFPTLVMNYAFSKLKVTSVTARRSSRCSASTIRKPAVSLFIPAAGRRNTAPFRRNCAW
jgi:iron complex outermembrane receptor protein